jgi:hypothetical protein
MVKTPLFGINTSIAVILAPISESGQFVGKEGAQNASFKIYTINHIFYIVYSIEIQNNGSYKGK